MMHPSTPPSPALGHPSDPRLHGSRSGFSSSGSVAAEGTPPLETPMRAAREVLHGFQSRVRSWVCSNVNAPQMPPMVPPDMEDMVGALACMKASTPRPLWNLLK